MRKFKKIIICMSIIAATLFVSSCGSSKIAETDVRSGSGKYIDCSGFVEKTENSENNVHISNILTGVEFENKEDFYSFFKTQSYTESQKARMADLAVNDMLELPQTDSMLYVKFTGEENINKIKWYGGDHYNYNLSAIFEETSFSFDFRPALSVQEVEEFLAKRDNDENRKKSVYTENGVKYIKYTGTTSDGADFTVFHWTVSSGDNTFYVYQSMIEDGTYYNYVRILVENSYGYQFITLENSADVSVIPEFVKQFEVYSQNIA